MIVTDAHTHIYPCYDLDAFFSAAFRNFSHAAARAGGGSRDGLIFLTETRGNDYFSLLKGQGSPSPVPLSVNSTWQVTSTGETSSLLITHRDFPGQRVFILAGRQMVTQENLEVLALASSGTIDEYQPLDKTIASILGDGAVAVLPWGVGKWLGKRQRILTSFLQQTRSPLLFVGDNGSRPRLWPKPAILRDSRQTEPLSPLRLLSGSDPLPLAGEEHRVGSFGSIIHTAIDPARPAVSIIAALADPRTVIRGFGSPQSTFRFVRQQLALRLS